MSDETQALTHTRTQGQMVWPDCIPDMKAGFLEEFVANGGVVTGAAKAVGTTSRTIYNWLKADPEFKDAFEDARQAANDTLRREIHRRAVEGWEEPVYQGGNLVGYTRKYSDTLLIFQAKARMPEYRDRMDITSNDQHINAHETIVEAVNDEQTTALAAELLERLTNIGNDTGRAGLDRE